MPKSRLEQYEDVMSALVNKYLSVDGLAFVCNMDCVAVNHRIVFLIKNGLVEEKICNDRKLYALTKRGLSIQKTLAITKQLDELKTTVKAIDETILSVPKSSDRGEEKDR